MQPEDDRSSNLESKLEIDLPKIPEEAEITNSGVIRPAANDGSASTANPTSEWRRTAGKQMDSFSNFINEHIVAARYGTLASIVLLSAYGLSNTPLFFRYNKLQEIPASYFRNRKTLHCRLIRVLKNDSAGVGNQAVEQPIVCLVRHLSPGERLLSRSAFDTIMRSRPSAALGTKLEDNAHELLKVELAGVRQPPYYLAPGYAEQPGEWLNRLAEQRTPVACQLLSRRAEQEAIPKREVKALKEFQSTVGNDQTAVCRMMYRPGGQFFRTDLANSLVRLGRGAVASGLYVPKDNWTVVDTSGRVEDLRKDAKYMEKLAQAEFEAAKESSGMWADPNVRASRQEIVEEVEFETNATFWQKLWRRFRG